MKEKCFESYILLTIFFATNRHEMTLWRSVSSVLSTPNIRDPNITFRVNALPCYDQKFWLSCIGSLLGGAGSNPAGVVFLESHGKCGSRVTYFFGSLAENNSRDDTHGALDRLLEFLPLLAVPLAREDGH